jgi:hypothetical protein
MASQKSRHNGFTPFEGYMSEFCACQRLGNFYIEVGCASDASRADTKFSGIFLCIVD